MGDVILQAHYILQIYSLKFKLVTNKKVFISDILKFGKKFLAELNLILDGSVPSPV